MSKDFKKPHKISSNTALTTDALIFSFDSSKTLPLFTKKNSEQSLLLREIYVMFGDFATELQQGLSYKSNQVKMDEQLVLQAFFKLKESMRLFEDAVVIGVLKNEQQQ